MIKHTLKTILFAFIFINVNYSSAQTSLVRKEWSTTNGLRDTIPYSATSIDSQGNLIVTSNILVSGQNANILTTKFAPDGAIIWSQQVNGTANSKDFGTANLIDNNGDIFIAGAIQNTLNNYDYFFAKYNSNGVLQWQNTYNGNGNNYDIPSAIAADNNFCYLTGVSLGITSLTDFATLKINKSTGVISWASSYDYTSLYELPIGITVNSNGNIYVTGASSSAINNWDIATVEYNTNGSQQNVDRSSGSTVGFDKPADIAKDVNGNIYVAGRVATSNNGYDIKLIKLNASLTPQWEQTFDGYGLDDEGTGLVLDNLGNILVCGFCKKQNEGKNFVVVKFDSNGNIIWNYEKDYGGNDEAKKIAIDNNNNTYIVGEFVQNNDKDLITIKLNSNGVSVWEKEYRNSGDDKAEALKVDVAQNVYINGQTTVSTEQNSAIKYEQVEALIPIDFNNEEPSSNNLFYENRRQLFNTNSEPATDVAYYTESSFPQQYIANDKISFVLNNHDTLGNDSLQRIDLAFLNSSPNTKAYSTKQEKLGYLNYFNQHFPDGIVNVKGSKKIVIPNLYNDIDLVYSSNDAGLKMYLVIKQRGKLEDVFIKLLGANGVYVNNQNLIVQGAWDEFNLGKLTAYQIQNNQVVPITSWTPSYNVSSNGTVGFNFGTYDTSLPLVIQISKSASAQSSSIPLENIEWSTYYHGNQMFKGTTQQSSTIDINHNLYTVGSTNQNDFPTTPNSLFPIPNGISYDAIIAKFDAFGERLFATYYGGSKSDIARSVTTNSLGDLFVLGETFSADFPPFVDGDSYTNITLPSETNQDLFIVKLSADGLSQLWSTNYGGTSLSEEAGQIAINNDGSVYVVGSGDFNTPHLVNGNFNNNNGGLLAKFKDNGERVWATGFGNSFGATFVKGIAFDETNAVYITGSTSTTNFPVVNSQAYDDYTSAATFVTKFIEDNTIEWSTFITKNYQPKAILFANNSIYVNGEATSGDVFLVDPGNGAFFNDDPFTAGCTKVFLIRLSKSGIVTWGTFYGGSFTDRAFGMTHDQFGNVYLAGYTNSEDFEPILQAPSYYFRPTFGSGEGRVTIEAFDAENKSKWGSYFGGNYSEAAYTASCDLSNNKLFIAGVSQSQTDFPLNNGNGIPYYQGTLDPNISSGFISRFNIEDNFTSTKSIINNAQDLLIFPNPAQNSIYLKLKQNQLVNNSVIISNNLGEEILRLENFNFNNPINISNLSSGMFIIKILSKDSILTCKFSKF
jgi:hypothetical protein